MILTSRTQSAIQVPFDPSPSTLVSTDVDAALKELSAAITSGILNYSVVSSTAFTSSSATDVLITGFTVTPASGTYSVWYNASALASQNNALLSCTIYKGGSSITESVRSFQSSSANNTFIQSTIAITNFNGSQACDVRVKTTQGSITVNVRNLILIRLGP